MSSSLYREVPPYTSFGTVIHQTTLDHQCVIMSYAGETVLAVRLWLKHSHFLSQVLPTTCLLKHLTLIGSRLHIVVQMFRWAIVPKSRQLSSETFCGGGVKTRWLAGYTRLE